MKQNKLDYHEAINSPCESCTSSPCCSLFQLDLVTVSNLMELDTINYYLNFNNIEICLSLNGEWTVYYSYPCRFFDKEKSICTLHATPQKPGICVNYNPHQCFYKKAKNTNQDGQQGLIWINRERMDFIMTQVSFDDDRNLLDVPEKEKLYQDISRIPYQDPKRVDTPGEDNAVIEWKQSVLSNTKITNGGCVKSYFDFQYPCQDCDSYCCKSLVFPYPIPSTYGSLDYIRYALGFPGVELGISDSQWYIILKTACSHLEGNQCTIYEKPERPLTCKYYSSMQCFHKAWFSQSKPNGFMRVGFEEFKGLLETFKFDEFGNIIEGYNVESSRIHVESKWLETVNKSSKVPSAQYVPAILSLEKMTNSAVRKHAGKKSN
jgi:hypothetical protein